MNETMNAQMKWAQRAKENASACRQALISSRVALSLVQISQDPSYQKLCWQREAGEQKFRQVLEKLSEKEQADRPAVSGTADRKGTL